MNDVDNSRVKTVLSSPFTNFNHQTLRIWQKKIPTKNLEKKINTKNLKKKKKQGVFWDFRKNGFDFLKWDSSIIWRLDLIEGN